MMIQTLFPTFISFVSSVYSHATDSPTVLRLLARSVLPAVTSQTFHNHSIQSLSLRGNFQHLPNFQGLLGALIAKISRFG